MTLSRAIHLIMLGHAQAMPVGKQQQVLVRCPMSPELPCRSEQPRDFAGRSSIHVAAIPFSSLIPGGNPWYPQAQIFFYYGVKPSFYL
jgi:hypothetical protein